MAMGLTIASCGNHTDGDGATARDSTEIGPGNTADSPKDTAVLVQDPNNNMNAHPVNDTSVNPDAVKTEVK